jgi:hypothetical protein
VEQKAPQAGAPHPDGDRRHKAFGAMARKAVADKKARREFRGPPAEVP